MPDLWLDLEAADDLSGLPDDSLKIVTRLLRAAGRSDQSAPFLNDALALVARSLPADFVALASVEQGRWKTLHEHGRRQTLPLELLGEALDRAAVGRKSIQGVGWYAAPLERRAASGRLLVAAALPGGVAATAGRIVSPATLASASPANAVAAALGDGDARHDRVARQLAALAPLFGETLAQVAHRDKTRRRLARLEAVLSLAGGWNQVRETEPLLVQIAQTATRLLEADRASIFLWDRAARQLVARPALGVEDGELRIPDDAGVVGRVVQTGQSERVGETRQHLVARDVDEQLGYQTRTILCVPLKTQDGQRLGAFEVINKRQGEFTAEDEAELVELAEHAAVALQNVQERELLLTARRQITEQAASRVRMIGESPAIAALRSTVSRVATTDLAVLILGENGTGKEVVAQSVHYLSERRDQPFIAVNCAAISETLLESELFGHEKGAFTDAHESRPGKFELASGGTLFLDEIGDMSLNGQAKLLRVLEEKVVVRVGGSKSIHTNARVIAATNQDLSEMVRQKRFRQDLFFRLCVVSVTLPPLRERTEDILLLADYFLGDFCAKARRKKPKFSPEARKRLLEHTWPGNVRELRNLMERLAYLTPGERIEAEDLAFILAPSAAEAIRGYGSDLPLSDATDRFQTEYIQQAIERARGNMSEAAKLLGLHRSNLYRKMRQLQMEAHEPEGA